MKVNVFDKYGETIGYHIELENVFSTYRPENKDIIIKILESYGEAILRREGCDDIFRLKNCGE